MSRALIYLPIGAIVALAAALRLTNLGQNGFSREYYAAAVRSQLQNWHNFFYNSFDPGGFVTLDKPPVGIWVQTLFAKLFGFSALNALLPQALLGIAAVLLLYFIVRRTFGESAGLLAALILALNPGSVAVDRTNNLESCLVVILLVAAYFGIRAAETGRLRYLAGAMLMFGIGFNVKMAAAVIAAPAIAVFFVLFNRQHALLRHARYQAVAGAIAAVVALSWVVAFDLTPAEQRPYAGSTKNNSMIELVLKHNGTERFTTPAAKTSASTASQPELYDTSPTGPFRLFRAAQAGQFAWFLPFAIAGILLGWRGERQRRIAIAIWAGWLGSYWVVYSAAGGPFHTYYLATLAPPLAALAGIGVSDAWMRYREGALVPILAILGTTAAWQMWLFYGQTAFSAPAWLNGIAVGAGLLILLAAYLLVAGKTKLRPLPPATSVLVLLALPIAAALSVVALRPNVIAPVASLAEYVRAAQSDDIARANPRRRDASRAKLVAFLLQNHNGEKFIVAVENALTAAPLIIATGKPVMAVGGYLGTDPILTPEKLQDLVARGIVRYALTGGLSFTKRDQPHEVTLRNWIKANGTEIDAGRWSLAPQLAGKTFNVRLGGALVAMDFPALFDLRPSSRQ